MARKPYLTIGMACYENWHEFWHTTEGLLVNHDMSHVQLMVIDNVKVRSKDSKDMESCMKMYEKKCAMSTYIHAGEVQGTSYPREQIMRRASSKYVCIIDPHIFIQRNGVENMIRYFEKNPKTNNLIQGPMWGYDLDGIQTVWRDGWRSYMWGKWGNIFEGKAGLRFSVEDQGGKCQWVSSGINPLPIEEAVCREHQLPVHLPYSGHEERLEAMGFKWLGKADDDEFEIPGMGLGLFACRREAWPHFNPHAKGFGGEEMYIHDKFRQRGDKCLCRGDWKWVHKFRRDDSEINYSHQTWDKVRNYVLERLEPGNIRGGKLDDIFQEFVVGGAMPKNDWDYLISDPIAHAINPDILRAENQDYRNRRATVVQKRNLNEVYEELKNTDRDLNKHMPKFAELAGKCNSVTEFSRRRESLIGFMAGQPKSIISHNTEGGIMEAINIPPGKDFQYEYQYDTADSMDVPYIDDTDLLFLDTTHTKERVSEELKRFGKNALRFIVLHDTVSFGIKGEDGGPGLIEAIKEFMEDNEEWFGVYNTDLQYGLAVLGRNEVDRPVNKVHFWVPDEGVGKELMDIISNVFGIVSSQGCDCKAHADAMNVWGIEACETFRFDVCVDIVRKNYQRWGWGVIAPDGEPILNEGEEVDFSQDLQPAELTAAEIMAGKMPESNGEESSPTRKFTAVQIAANMVTSGLAWRINPRKPFHSLIKECVRRAKLKAKASDKE